MESLLNNINPWKGLNFYKEGEILYGRNNEIESLSQFIINNTQTVLYGKSGIGKSSILNAGIFPIARKAGMVPIPMRLDHNKGISYIDQIRTAITESKVDIHEIVPVINDSKETLWEFFHRNIFFDKNGTRIQLLLVFDQFEEFFTLQQNELAKRTFFDELADLINDITPLYIINSKKNQNPPPSIDIQEVTESLDSMDIDINLDEATESETKKSYLQRIDHHIVFTLREDFLSYLERYTAYIPAMKSNRYALLPINEEQAADIIMKPVKGLIDKNVAELIIRKVTGKIEFKLDGIPELEVDAAVLSLYLSRLYVKKGIGDVTITAELVNQFSSDIIKDFYEESIKDLPQAAIEKIEDRLLTYEGRRNNVSRSDLVKEGVYPNVLNTLVEDRKLLRQFSYQDDIRVEFMHDILCPVVNERISQRETAKRQAEEQRVQEERQKKLLEEEQRKRDAIEAQAKADRIRMEEEAKEQKMRTRRIIIGFVLLATIAGIGVAYYYYYYKHVYSTYYKSYELVNGWPVGIGELSITELGHFPLYYKLSHKGYKRENTDIEVCSSNEKLPQGPRIPRLLETDYSKFDNKAFDYIKMLSQVKSIHFEAGEKGRINKEVIKGDNDSILFFINYFHLETEGQAWIQFVSSYGQSMAISDNGMDRIKLTWVIASEGEDNRNSGRIRSLMFYDALGVSQPATTGNNGYSISYSDDGLVTQRIALDEFGRPFDSKYNVKTTRISGDTTIVQYSHISLNSDNLEPTIGPDGVWKTISIKNEQLLYLPLQSDPAAKRILSKDSKGNTIKILTESLSSSISPSVIKRTFSDKGYLCSEENLNPDGTPLITSDSIYLYNWQYSEEGNIISAEYYNTQKELVYSKKIERHDNVIYERTYDRKNKERPTLLQIDSSFNDYKSTSFFSTDNIPINIAAYDSSILFHRQTITTEDNKKTTCFYSYDNSTGKECRQVITKNKFGGVKSYYKKVEVFDSDNNMTSYQIFDEEDHIVKSMMYFYQNGQQVARAAMGIEGTPVRSPEWEEEGFGYYKIYFAKDFSNNYSGITAVNEWEDPSIFYDGVEQEYKQVDYGDFKGWLMTKDNHAYDILNSYKQFVFNKDKNVTNSTIPYIHILDRSCSVYDSGKGLKDGDRLIKVGNWEWGQSTEKLATVWQRMKKTPVEIEVLRPTKNGLERKEFLMQVRSSDLDLVEYRLFAMTPSELQMINRILKHN